MQKKDVHNKTEKQRQRKKSILNVNIQKKNTKKDENKTNCKTMLQAHTHANDTRSTIIRRESHWFSAGGVSGEATMHTNKLCGHTTKRHILYNINIQKVCQFSSVFSAVFFWVFEFCFFFLIYIFLFQACANRINSKTNYLCCSTVFR